MESISDPKAEPNGQWAAMFEVGEAERFDAFYRRELPALVALAVALSGSASAEDIAQEAMLAAYRRWDVVSHLDLPAAWVRRVCANRCVSTLRRRAVEGRAMLRLGARRIDAFMTEEHES